MKTGFFFTTGDFTNAARPGARGETYGRIREEIAARYESRLARATWWERDWLNWTIDLLAEIRYNRLLFQGAD